MYYLFNWMVRLLMLQTLCWTQPAFACWEAVAVRYQINPYLLAAIAKTESNFNPAAIHYNANGTRDLGLMQINSAWLPELARMGIQESDLRDPCVNLSVGAWLLYRQQRAHGNTWESVGRYHSATPRFKQQYMVRVHGNLNKMMAPTLEQPRN